jgi:cytidylate kinase/transcriptional regulator with XRE-family HTH domain/DNA-binding phage protein
MIKNERQLRITKTQAEKFRAAIRALESSETDKSIHPVLRKAEIEGLRSQLADLDLDIQEYEALRSGQRRLGRISSFQDLPRALIQARIAAGLTQEQLAAKLKLKAQQIQRYEATDYQSASLARIGEIVPLLGIDVGRDVLTKEVDNSTPRLVDRLREVGLQSDFVLRRLLPKPRGSAEESSLADIGVEAAEAIGRVYGWSPATLFGSRALQLASTASGRARFKLPARVRKSGLGAYVVYAHYLALLVLEACSDLEAKPLPANPLQLRREILGKYGELTFETTLKFLWSLGVPVLPLNDPGGFHGACWRVNGRNVIVLHQRTKSATRWLHDLLHEYFHAADHPTLEEHSVIEESETSSSRRTSAEETNATQFAGDVMLDGKAEELAEACVHAANGAVERLKSVVPKVAREAGMSVEALANYMAFRLAFQGINWWGAATNLQLDGSHMLCTPRELLLRHARLSDLNPIDRDLLLRALEPVVLAFTGRIGSGKTTLSQQVADALGWKRASFGDYLRDFAKGQGLETSREVLQELGESLINKGVDEFCRSVLTHYEWRSGEPLVIDGIRHRAVVEALTKLVAPLELRLVFVEVAERERLKRLQRLEKDILPRLADVEGHSTEREVVATLRDIAQWRINGDRRPDEVVQDILGKVRQADGVEQTCAV